MDTDKKIKQTTIRLEESLWKEARMQALEEDKPFAQWIVEAIQEKLDKSKNN